LNIKKQHVIQLRPQLLAIYAEEYQTPKPEEVKEVIRMIGLSGSDLAKKLGIKDSRTIRKWSGGESGIPYLAWRSMLYLAGFISASEIVQ